MRTTSRFEFNPSLALLGIVILVLTAGCGRTYPVQEVTVAESGVVIADPAWPVSGSDWNGWRGPTSDGVATDQTLPTEWNDGTNIRWRTELPGRGHGSPIVIGDAVFLATAVESTQQQAVISLSRSDGMIRWNTVIHDGGFPSSRELHQKSTHANGTIASNGEQLFVAMFNSGSIFATALSLDGEIIWQREVGRFVSKFGYAPSPVLYKSLVIIAADTRGGGYLAALDTKTGEIAWRVARPAEYTYSSPTVATVGGRDQLLISGAYAVTSYDPSSGQLNWSTECLTEATCGTVVTSDDRIFASGGFPKAETVCLTADGHIVWTNETKVYEPSLLLFGENLLAVTDHGIAICMSAESGEERWKKRLGGSFSASPVLCGGNVYVSNLNGDTFVFQVKDRYEQVARNRLGDDCYASPAISDGEIFLRIGVGKGPDRKEQLVCVSTESPKSSSD